MPGRNYPTSPVNTPVETGCFFFPLLGHESEWTPGAVLKNVQLDRLSRETAMELLRKWITGLQDIEVIEIDILPHTASPDGHSDNSDESHRDVSSSDSDSTAHHSYGTSDSDSNNSNPYDNVLKTAERVSQSAHSSFSGWQTDRDTWSLGEFAGACPGATE